MKANRLIFLYILIVIAAILVVAKVSNKPSVVQNTLPSQTATIGIVTYKVTPKNLSRSSISWDFEIVLDTHTGSLDQDLVQRVRLSDDKAREYQATKWEGDPPGGHHREGTIQFKSGSDVKSITLKINPGKNMEEKSLTWEIKE